MQKADQLCTLLSHAARDARLLPVHLSLYTAVLIIWQQSNFCRSFRISRKELMRLGKLASTATYHKCLKELIGFGYLTYQPSYDHYRGSRITLIHSCATVCF